MKRADRASLGFTLIEVVGAFFMTVLILVFVTGIFVGSPTLYVPAMFEQTRKNGATTGTGKAAFQPPIADGGAWAPGKAPLPIRRNSGLPRVAPVGTLTVRGC